MDFTGVWDVVSSPDFDDDYLHIEVAPYVKLRQEGDRVEGEYHLGLQTGDVDGRLESEDRIVFSFEGMDEMDPVDGTATATLEGDRLIFVLVYGPGGRQGAQDVYRGRVVRMGRGPGLAASMAVRGIQCNPTKFGQVMVQKATPQGLLADQSGRLTCAMCDLWRRSSRC